MVSSIDNNDNVRNVMGLLNSINLDMSGGVEMMFAAFNMMQAQLNKDKANETMDKLIEFKIELATCDEMIKKALDLQNQAGGIKGYSEMPSDMRAFFETRGIPFDLFSDGGKYGTVQSADNKHNPTEWSFNLDNLMQYKQMLLLTSFSSVSNLMGGMNMFASLQMMNNMAEKTAVLGVISALESMQDRHGYFNKIPAEIEAFCEARGIDVRRFETDRGIEGIINELKDYNTMLDVKNASLFPFMMNTTSSLSSLAMVNNMIEQQLCAQMMEEALALQAEAQGKGSSYMPPHMVQFFEDRGIHFDTYGNDDLHNTTEWQTNINALAQYQGQTMLAASAATLSTGMLGNMMEEQLCRQMIIEAKYWQAEAEKTGMTHMPPHMVEFFEARGISFDTRGNDTLHKPHEWENNINSLLNYQSQVELANPFTAMQSSMQNMINMSSLSYTQNMIEQHATNNMIDRAILLQEESIRTGRQTEMPEEMIDFFNSRGIRMDMSGDFETHGAFDWQNNINALRQYQGNLEIAMESDPIEMSQMFNIFGVMNMVQNQIDKNLTANMLKDVLAMQAEFALLGKIFEVSDEMRDFIRSRNLPYKEDMKVDDFLTALHEYDRHLDNPIKSDFSYVNLMMGNLLNLSSVQRAADQILCEQMISDATALFEDARRTGRPVEMPEAMEKFFEDRDIPIKGHHSFWTDDYYSSASSWDKNIDALKNYQREVGVSARNSLFEMAETIGEFRSFLDGANRR